MALIDGLRNREQESSHPIFLQKRDRSVSRRSISDLHEEIDDFHLVTARSFVGADDDHSHIQYEQSCSLTEIERTKIRQIFQGWKRTGMTANKTSISLINDDSRPDCLGGTEQERVRIVGDCRESRKDHHEYQRHNLKRTTQKFCGRQALVDMLKKAERERREEIELLLKQRPVSRFTHRKLIQSLLKSRFLRNDIMDDSPRSASSIEGELNILRRRYSVSGLRKGFLSQSDNSVCLRPRTDHISTTFNRENDAGLMTERDQPSCDEILHDCQKESEGIDKNSVDGINPVTDLAEQTNGDEEDDCQETLQNGIKEPSNKVPDPVRELQTLDEDDYPLEIQELLRRRIVSTLLDSSFSVRLEQLLRSYVEKQGYASSKFDLDSLTAAENEDLDKLSEVESVDQTSTVENPPLYLNSPPWQDRRSEIDWDIINAMKDEIARLEHRMSCLKEMVESCMDMQLQLQRLTTR